MIFDMSELSALLRGHDIRVLYSGPLEEEGIQGITEMFKSRLLQEDMPGGISKAIFSVFVEQVSNMLYYSAWRDRDGQAGRDEAAATMGVLAVGERADAYFIQTGHAIGAPKVETIRRRIDHLNSMDKKALRQYHRERLKADNDNPESRGGGLGLIEIARRAVPPLRYVFRPIDDRLTHFTLYAEVKKDREGV